MLVLQVVKDLSSKGGGWALLNRTRVGENERAESGAGWPGDGSRHDFYMAAG